MSARAPFALAQSFSPVQPILPRDIPNGPWQEIATDYLTHKGRECLLACILFSKYPFPYKVSPNSTKSLCMHLPGLISQYGLPCLLYTDNSPTCASEEHAQFLQHSHIDHVISSPHIPRSNGFTEWQVRTLKTTLSTAQNSQEDARRPSPLPLGNPHLAQHAFPPGDPAQKDLPATQ